MNIEQTSVAVATKAGWVMNEHTQKRFEAVARQFDEIGSPETAQFLRQYKETAEAVAASALTQRG